MEPFGKAHVFVRDLDALRLDDHDRHHLERVLRLRRGDELTASDGAGGWRTCRFGPALEPVGAIETDTAPQPEIAIAFALVKGDRNEWIVQKLTELGVDRIIPFTAARSVVRWEAAKADRQRARFGTVAREAAMQSRRSWLPAIEPIAAFADVVSRPGAALADRGGDPPTLAHPLVMVGPEGGWSDEEWTNRAQRVTLGSTVLRSETAAIAAAVALCGLRSALFESKTRHGG